MIMTEFGYSVDLSQYEEEQLDVPAVPAPAPALLMIEPAPGIPHVGSRMLDRQARDAERGGAHAAWRQRPEAAATRLQAAFRAHRARAWLRERRGAVRTIQRLRQQLAARRRGVAAAAERGVPLALAAALGIDVAREPALLFVAEQLLAAPLPAGWVEYLDDAGDTFYYHEAQNESTFDHPLEAKFQRRVAEARRRMRASGAWQAERERRAAAQEAAQAAQRAELLACRDAARRKEQGYVLRAERADAAERLAAETASAAATAIQAAWRARTARRSTAVELDRFRAECRLRAAGAERRAAAAARASRESDRARVEEQARSAARVRALQSKHAAVAQAVFRGRRCRRELVALDAGAVALQSMWRGRRCRQEASAESSAALVVQAAFREVRAGCRAGAAAHRRNFRAAADARLAGPDREPPAAGLDSPAAGSVAGAGMAGRAGCAGRRGAGVAGVLPRAGGAGASRLRSPSGGECAGSLAWASCEERAASAPDQCREAPVGVAGERGAAES